MAVGRVAVLFHFLFLAEVYAAVPADLVTNLPGLTFDPGFKQYSGYLQVPSGNALHYW